MALAVAENPPIRQVLDEGKGITDAGTAKARKSVGEQLRDASGLIRDKVG